MKEIFIAACIFFCVSCTEAQSTKAFDDFRDSFVKGYTTLAIPELELSYADNLQHILPLNKIQQQLNFFEDAKNKLDIFETYWLTDSEKFDLDLMKFETTMNLQRLALEKRWCDEKPAVIPVNNLYSIPHGNEWYVYFLKRWLGADVNPDDIYFNGIAEIDRVKQHIEDIRIKKGLTTEQFYAHLNDSDFFINSPQQLQQSFEHVKNIVQQNLYLLFNVQQVRNVKIDRGSNNALAQTPGYYNDDTFYYNFFDKPYNKRQVDWLFIHEAVPGHHYQINIADHLSQSKVQQLFHYSGFAEGWAAYTETLGTELGVYETDYDELGHWEWDLVRSVRVIIDIGLNYYGWNDEKALATWKQYIPNQDDIAMREINRIKRWPAQVITYKYGSMLILKWKKELQDKQGNAFNIKDFHDRLLNHGSLPFFMVKQNVFKKSTGDVAGS
ncbi:DUF885 domain-containing protein [Panacibacter ginsenosidivorans]|uniref:DUF885 domain-containing protein n=1 Tax=Panacibacter ginsenosidivorans TaxID=1813871 RepID=A0A5B8V6G8_9BACT|nr:DUF885 domain-containing protein [Panacibacter ginsenosidivorans]QEC66473.1 DUF885 domain-containing protein [Panacibacter ginsenosidivorans]